MRRSWLSAIAISLPILTVLLALALAVNAEGKLAMREPEDNPLKASEKQAACVGPALSPCLEVEYAILLVNSGAVDLERVSVTDPLPADTAIVLGRASPNMMYHYDENAVRWVGRLEAGTTEVLSFTVSSRATEPTVVTNTATICVEDPLPDFCLSRAITTELDASQPTPTPDPTETPTPTATPVPYLWDDPIEMTCDLGEYEGNTDAGVQQVHGYACAEGDWSGPEIVYHLPLAQPLEWVGIELKSGTEGLGAFVFTAPDSASCLIGGEPAITLTSPYVAGDLYVVVDGRDGAAGDYLLRLSCGPTVPIPTPTATLEPTETPTETPTPTATPVLTFRAGLPLLLRHHPEPEQPTPTPTPAWPVSLEVIWSEGPKGVVNDIFRRCEVLYAWAEITNHAGETRPITISWEVRDWQGRLVPGMSYPDWSVKWPAGTARVVLARTIPANAELDAFKSLTVRVTNPNGATSERLHYFKVSSEPPTSSPIAELVTCRQVDQNGLPDGVTSVFSSRDREVYAWAWWQRADGRGQTIRWDWHSPDGELYASHLESVSQKCSFYAWTWLKIADTDVAARTGTWTVRVWLDDKQVGARTFKIVAGQVEASVNETAMTGGGHTGGFCGQTDCRPITLH